MAHKKHEKEHDEHAMMKHEKKGHKAKAAVRKKHHSRGK
jgi:hypothetical protein